MKIDIKQTFFRWLPWLIIALGFVLRLDQYLFNRSLWLDEAFFVVNVVDRTFLELFKAPLEYTGHIMPPGILVMAKLFITLFGNSDFILRLFPFLCGIVSLVLFYQLAKIYLSAKAVPLALFLFAISDSLIIYSSMFKQYSSDVMIAIALLLLVAHLRRNTLTFARLFILTIVGILAVWFSHASVFILATIGIYLILPYLLNKQWQTVIELSAVYWAWLLSFAILYFLIINIETPTNAWMHEFWTIHNAFMPSPFSVEWLQWFYDKFLLTMKNPASLEHVELAGIFVIIGCISMLANRKGILFLLTLPVLIALIASFFEQYAFHGRLLLFLMPALYLIIAEGIVQLQVRLLPYPKTSIVTIAIQMILFVSIIDFPLYNRNVHKEVPVQEIKPALEHVQENKQANDVIYLYYWAEPAFRYYAKYYDFNYEDCHIITPLPTNKYTKEVDYSRNKRNLKPVRVNETQCILGISEYFGGSKRELDKLRGRVWFIFSHVGGHRRELFVKHLDKRGTRLDEKIQPGVFVYLYKL
jgi:4-amino-4-deoxy-L-arabinose transferase-like glycosyltransferase